MKDDKCEAFSDIPHPENSQLQFYLEVTYKSQLKQCTKPWTLFKGYDIDSKGEDEDCKVEFKCGILDKLKDKKENSKCFFTGPEKNLILPEAGKVTLENDWYGFKFPEAGMFNLTAKLKEAEIRFPSVTIGEQTTTSELTTTELTTVPTTPSISVAETSPATEA
ncbi:hypothetical protein L596_012515 [Steinernema carpocapsae]|uniref:Uncharacterized protein n=1 Tax=Steinernema carpocapsae TaxID=34508 RepID=A0A4U5NXE8_STECR|nr:hypothetical protein L596_012515 [Steinernema carpocapsae]